MTVHNPANTVGATVWFTGLPSAGKTTLATALAARLAAARPAGRDPRRRRGPAGAVARTRLLAGPTGTPTWPGSAGWPPGWPGTACWCWPRWSRRSRRPATASAPRTHAGRRAVPRGARGDAGRGLRRARRQGPVRPAAQLATLANLTGIDGEYEVPVAPELVIDTASRSVDDVGGRADRLAGEGEPAMTAVLSSRLGGARLADRPRGRVDPHHPRGVRPVRASGAAVLRRQGLDRDAAPGDEGVLAGPAAVPADARRHRPQLRRGDRVPRPPGGRDRRAAGGGQRPGGDRLRPGHRDARRHPQSAADRAAARRASPRNRFDAVLGGARRDEEKARAKERVFSVRDDFGQWDPRNQRPELWDLYNGRHRPGEHVRVFPLSNWTELDIWSYIEREGIEVPSIYYAHQRPVFERDGMLLAVTEYTQPREGETVRRRVGALPHRRRCHLHRSGALAGRRRGRDRRRDRGQHDLRARRHPGRRPGQRGGDGRPQAAGVLLMSDAG